MLCDSFDSHVVLLSLSVDWHAAIYCYTALACVCMCVVLRSVYRMRVHLMLPYDSTGCCTLLTLLCVGTHTARWCGHLVLLLLPQLEAVEW